MNYDKRAKAIEENTVLWRDYRITALASRLFRLEKSKKKKFRDNATQTVLCRDMPKVKFSVETSDETCVITTECVKLVLKRKLRDCRVIIDGEEKPITNDGNLGGTCRTLDVCDGGYKVDFGKHARRKINLGVGVCSRSGVAVIDDSSALSLDFDGRVNGETADGTDEYIFVYGKDYRGAVAALYTVTGKVPLVPRFALGNWWSRFYPYSDKDYLRLLNRFDEHNVPLTVATIDMDWHYSLHVDEEKGITASGRNTPFYGGNNGWTGFSWNTKLFPDHKTFLKELHKRGLKVTLNLHPADGVRWWEDCYRDFAADMGIDPDTGKRIAFDFSDPKFISAYFRRIIDKNEKDGVDFWWVDWQQGTTSEVKGLDPLWALNHYHYADNAAKNERGLILSRYAGVGSHRYPVGFSGDTFTTWRTLAYLPYFTYTASNVGYSWWSHDIGGHMLGKTDFQLYLRHIQFGVFNPIMRLHSSDVVPVTKEPWYYKNGTGMIAEEWLRLRHSLIPHLYSLDKMCNERGNAVVEPLYYEYPDEERAYDKCAEYLFGGNVVVAPVITPLEKDGYAHTEVWIPEGKWTDMFTRDEYKAGSGGKLKVLLRRLESIPVLVRAGGVIVTSGDKGNSIKNPEKLIVKAYSGDGDFTLFEDDGKKSAETIFTMKGEKDKQTLEISSTGDRAVIPENRIIKVIFENIRDGEIRVTADGKPVGFEAPYEDRLSVIFDYDSRKVYKITIKEKPLTELEKLKLRTAEELESAEGDNPDKQMNCYLPLMRAGTIEEFKEIMKYVKVSDSVKARLSETL
mgnify:CR=1 FL=1